MNMLIAIVLSSAVAGTLDLSSAVFLAKKRGMSFTALLQFVASGALGEAAFQGGLGTATAGMLFHYLIAVLWATAYYLLRGTLPDTLIHPFAFGALYGVVVHLVMSLVVIPLSRTPKKPFAWQPWLIQLPIHVAFVGLPIALVQSWWLRG
jgi:hypothetical protein